MNLGLGLDTWPYGNMIQYQYVQIESVLWTVSLLNHPAATSICFKAGLTNDDQSFPALQPPLSTDAFKVMASWFFRYLLSFCLFYIIT